MIGLFSQIRTGGDIVRGRAIKFLLVKIKTEGTDLLNKETESHLLEEIKLCMGEVSKFYQCVWWSTAIFVIKSFVENAKNVNDSRVNVLYPYINCHFVYIYVKPSRIAQQRNSIHSCPFLEWQHYLRQLLASLRLWKWYLR